MTMNCLSLISVVMVCINAALCGSEYYVMPSADTSSLGASGLLPRKIFKSSATPTTTYLMANGRPLSTTTTTVVKQSANDYAVGHGLGTGLGSGLGTGLSTGLSKSLAHEAGTSAALGQSQQMSASGKLYGGPYGYGGFGRGYDHYDPYDSYDPYNQYDPFRRPSPRLAQSGYHLGYKLGHGVGYGLGYGLGQGIGKGLNTGLDGGSEDDNGGGPRKRGRSGKLTDDKDGQQDKEDKGEAKDDSNDSKEEQ